MSERSRPLVTMPAQWSSCWYGALDGIAPLRGYAHSLLYDGNLLIWGNGFRGNWAGRSNAANSHVLSHLKNEADGGTMLHLLHMPNLKQRDLHCQHPL